MTSRVPEKPAENPVPRLRATALPGPLPHRDAPALQEPNSPKVAQLQQEFRVAWLCPHLAQAVCARLGSAGCPGTRLRPRLQASGFLVKGGCVWERCGPLWGQPWALRTCVVARGPREGTSFSSASTTCRRQSFREPLLRT